MLKNYITIAFRNISRNLTYTGINLAGLTLGITGSLVLFLLIQFQTSFDEHHPQGDRTYRVVYSAEIQGHTDYGAGLPNPMPDAIYEDIAGVEAVLRVSQGGYALVRVDQGGMPRRFEEESVAYTDSTYFQLIDQPLLKGSGALNAPYQAVITPALAVKYFGDENPLGKVFNLNNEHDFTITGIMSAAADNSSFPFQMLLSWSTVQAQYVARGWGSVSSGDQCFVLLKPGVQPAEIETSFATLVEKHQNDEMRPKTYRLQPIDQLKHDGRYGNFRGRTAGMESIWAMVIIALFLILTACINFINLTTAVAVRRSKEIGIRKVLGSARRQLIVQHLCETAMITLAAIVLAACLTELALLSLNTFLEIKLHITLNNPPLWAFVVLVWSGVTLGAGLYPAFLLSGYKPARVLKNTLATRHTGGYALRRGLVIGQFVISQLLIVCTIILLAQMRYVQTKDLGFNKEAVVMVPLAEANNADKKRSLKSIVSQMPGVARASLCFHAPSSSSWSRTHTTISGLEGNLMAHVKTIDEDYAEVFELQLAAGRALTTQDTAQACLVNEYLVSTLHLPENDDILGRQLNAWGDQLTIVGVVKDFNAMSLENPMVPIILFEESQSNHMLAVKLNPGNYTETLEAIEDAWQNQYPDYLFQYEFLDKHIARFYEGAQKIASLLLIFSGIAIFIGCLGLYGLVSFMANQKEKEFGVRKVLGATTAQILGGFSKEFVILIFIAFVLSSPLAGYIMNQWLQRYVYHITLTWPMFINGMLVTLFVAFATIAYRAIHTAQKNPADVLRDQ